MPRHDLLVPPGFTPSDHPEATVLHVYGSGEALVRTSEPLAGRAAEQGLRLDPELAAGLDAARSGGVAAVDAGGERLAYVEMAGPIAPAWLDRLMALAVVPLRFQPVNTYLCRGTSTAFAAAAAEPVVLRVTPLVPGLKRKLPLPGDDAEESWPVWIVVQANDDERTDTLQTLRALPGVTIEPDAAVDPIDRFLHVAARVSRAGLAAACDVPRVLAVEERASPRSEDELADLILCGQYDGHGRPFGSYLQWLAERGLSGAGVAIGVVDAGVDTSHVAFQGRIRDLSEGTRDWHGTFVAGHAAGAYLDEKDADGFIYGVGVAPRAELLVQSNQKSAAELCRETVTQLGPGGARGVVQNNSWGLALARDPARMDYGAIEASYDSLVRNADPGGGEARPLTICFSSGNSGGKGLTRPKAAKNVIVTGNSESCRTDVGQEDSDNIGEVYAGTHPSSWGNCGDGRIRPDIVAPGEWTASANYDCQPGEREYLSPRLTWGGGSSAASPKTAGACALLIQWWRRHHAEPSPALLRGLLVNGAEPMNFRRPIPNCFEGWGRLNLANVLDESVARVYDDQSQPLRERGEQRIWNVRVADRRRPVKITLSWTDPPGAVGSGDRPDNSAIVNSLVLRAFVGPVAFRGNNFQNGWSVSAELPGAQAEGADNLQNIFLPPGVADGPFRVVVEARNITSNCLDPRSVAPQQDFALIISNARMDEAETPVEVHVALDPSAGEAPPADPEGYWQHDEVDGDRVELAGGPQPPVAAAPTAVEGDEAAWWAAGDPVGAVAEGTRRSADGSSRARVASATAAVERQLAPATAVGARLIAAAPDARVLFAAEPPVTSRRADQAAPAAATLPTALERLAAAWGGAELRPGAAGRRCAVLVVGRGTRISRVDLARLRRLALFGCVYLVSEDAGVLQFLAQRLHLRRGLELRLAADAAALPALVRDTMAEASGAHRVVVEVSAPTDAAAWIARFAVVPADRRIVVAIAVPDVDAPTIRLRRPTRDGAETVTPDGAREGLSVRRDAGLYTLTVAAPAAGAPWAGSWEVEVSRPVGAGRGAALEVQAWAWSDLHLQVTARRPGPTAEAGGRAERLVLESDPGVVFRAVEVQPLGGGVAAEASRPVVVRPRASRLDRTDIGLGDSPGGEAERQVLTTTIIGIPAPRVTREQPGAQLASLLLSASGVDRDDHPFQRIVPYTSCALEPRPAWGERLAVPAAARFVVLTAFRVAGVEYAADSADIVGLVVEKQGKRRRIRVASPQLRRAVGRIDLRGADLRFRVAADELCAVVVALDRG